jgi:hypothetical protein
MILGQGFRPYLLSHIANICKDATPQYKIEPDGFLNFLQMQDKPKFLRLNTEGGHKLQAQVKYKQRWTKEFVGTSIDCGVTNVPSYRETSVDLTSTRAIVLNFEDERIAQYEEDASTMRSAGSPPTDFMNEILDEIMTAASALLQAVNVDLQTTFSTKIGVNRTTGNNATRAININQDTNILQLTNGFNEMLADYTKNGGSGVPEIIGSGIFYNWMLNQASKSTDQSGVNSSIQARGVRFHHDLNFASTFGTNQIIWAQPNSVQIVEYLRNKGFKSGLRGTSTFGTILLPVQTAAGIMDVEFDYQLRYNDCAQTLTDQYYGSTILIQPGFNLMLSKQCGLFTIPSDAYRSTDPLTGNRGTLRYTISNS